MSDRLKDLQRQRVLAQEQLAWFDREIAKESGQASAPAAPATPVASIAPPRPATPDTDAARMADEILTRYRSESASSPRNVKRGCFLYFFFALGALIIFTVGAYYLYINLR